MAKRRHNAFSPEHERQRDDEMREALRGLGSWNATALRAEARVVLRQRSAAEDAERHPMAFSPDELRALDEAKAALAAARKAYLNADVVADGP